MAFISFEGQPRPANTYQQTSYGYDAKGNITSMNTRNYKLQDFSSNQTFSYDAADQLLTANAINAEGNLYNVVVSYGKYGRINTSSTSFRDPQTNILQSYNNNYTYQSVNAPSNSFAPVSANNGDIAFEFGINGSLRKRTDTNKTEYYLFNAFDQMKAYSDDKVKYGYYGYDDAGQRMYKVQLSNFLAQTNTLGGKLLEVEKMMLYPNGYLNIDQSGNYTKHYYADAQRVASKIGNGSNKTVSYNAGNQQTIRAFEEMRKELGELTGDTVDNINLPNGWEQITHLQGDSGNYEDGLFFYHGNHLSSTQLITDMQGDVTQAVLYTPHGQVISEYRQDWKLDTIPRYLFNAKELDEESGMYYFEARYQNPNMNIFISPDPLFEKNPFMSKYAYCSNNPINRIDLTGEIDFPLKGNSAVNKKDCANQGRGLKNTIVRTSLYQEKRNIGSSPHVGIDYRASIGTPVYSLGDGVVSKIDIMKSGIKYITITYENGDNVRFLHMDNIAEGLKKGTKVYEGQVIGYSGNSGQYYDKKTGTMKNYNPHLHVDATDKNGNPISPEQNKYGTVDNKTFFEKFGGDYMKLRDYKEIMQLIQGTTLYEINITPIDKTRVDYDFRLTIE